ncbi:MAG: translocation/assembly module TamB [Bacteroidia bacterium]|nr:translocation/assembly module TamB [Bacteroidia bacterium]
MKKIWVATYNITVRVLVIMVTVLLVLAVTLQVPAVQTVAVKRMLNWASSKTHAQLSIGSVHLSLFKGLVLRQVFIGDMHQDTLASIDELSVDINLWKAFSGTIVINDLRLVNATVTIKRNVTEGFNFDFLVNAFTIPSSKTDATPLQPPALPLLQLEKLVLESVYFNYLDSVTGIFSVNQIDLVEMEVREFDLNRLAFNIPSLALTGINSQLQLVSVVSNNQNPNPNDTPNSVLPSITLGSLTATELLFDLTMSDTANHLNVRLGKGKVIPRIIDLNKSHIAVKDAWFEDCQTAIVFPASSNEKDQDTISSAEWFVDVMDLRLENSQMALHLDGKQPLQGAVDYSHLEFANINLAAADLHYHGIQASGQLKQMAFTERSGLTVTQGRSQFAFTGNEATLSGLFLQTNQSVIANYAHVSGLNQLSDLKWQVAFARSKVSINELLMLAPQLKSDVWLAQNKNQVITLNGSINGTNDEIAIKQLVATTATQTAIAVNGSISNPFDSQQLQAKLQLQSFTSTQQDLASIVPQTYLPKALQFPKQFQLRGQITGGLSNAMLSCQVNSTDGSINVEARLNDLINEPTLTIDAGIYKWAVGRSVQVKELGLVTANIHATYSGKDWQKATAEIDLTIPFCDYLAHPYQDMKLVAKVEDGVGKMQLNIADTALIAAFDATVNIAKKPFQIQLQGEVTDANLEAMNLSKTPLRIAVQTQLAIAASNWSDAKADLKLRNLIIAQRSNMYETKLIEGSLSNAPSNAPSNTPSNTVCSLTSDWFKFNYEGSVDVLNFSQAVTNWSNWIHQQKPINAIPQQQQMKVSVSIEPHPMISGLLLPSIKQFNGLQLAFAQQKTLADATFKLRMPLLVMDEVQLYGASIDLKPVQDMAQYVCSLDSMTSGLVWLPQTRIKGQLASGLVNAAVEIVHPDSGYRLKLATHIDCKPNAYKVTFKPDTVIVMNTAWAVNPNHSLIINHGNVNATELLLHNNQESISIQSTGKAIDAPLRLVFQKVNLQRLSQIIERKESLVSGTLSGEALLIDTRIFAFTANVSLQQLVFRNYLIGDLALTAANNGGTNYTIDASLSGNGNKANVAGTYNDDDVDLRVDIASITMQTVQSFAPKYLRSSSGVISSEFTIKGSLRKPIVKGDIRFREASFILAAINNRLRLHDEVVQFDQDGLYFKQFSVLDSMNQPLDVKGAIYFDKNDQQTYALDVKTRNFRVLNTTAKNNKLYYGTVLLNSDIQIRGNSTLPKVDAKVSLLEGTNVTVVVQQGELSTDKGDGIVVFKQDSLPFGLLPLDSGKYSALREIEVTANIDINKATVFNIITDQESGDNLSVSGAGAIGFGIDRSGKMSLVGVYTLSQGKYKASFQKIVKREFDIKEGSTISWTGDLLNADINITATYRTKAGATDLLAQELAGFPPEERNVYRRLLTYDVNLVMKGLLLNPELSFMLDMPIPKEQNEFNGLPYAKINQVNNDPNELNKQVFSLLILDRFLPVGQSVSPSATEAVSAVARNSVNQLLSDQLNRYSGKWIKGAELNFDLQSVDDYNSAKGNGQTTTELQVGIKKELLNNKMSVQVGSSINMDANAQNSNAQNITGDVVVEYKITDDGRYRFKAFRENQFEGLIDGMLYKTGIGVVYSRDYNTISELLTKPTKKDTLP